MDTTLTIHVAGRADEISPKIMAKAFAAFADLLEAPDDGSHWTMVGAHLGSLTLEARPSARSAEEERAIFDTLVSGLSFFNESGEAPESWSPQGRAAVRALRELTTAPGVEGITAAVPDQTIVFTPVDGDSEPESRRRVSIGSVTGVIDRINTRQGCEFGLIDEAERHPVKVLFSAAQLDAVKPLVGKRVRARGELTRNAQGWKTHLRLRKVEVAEKPDRVPPLEELFGVLGPLPNGVDAEGIVQEMRRA